ncbi:MAG: DUF1579 family protein [Planctomycetes bacterium]|nr:DUF1579 family protein [Planctomycetota bacterium]MBL7039002.1 DUF1579 family protein [Pirellulaceae bacterium]
MRCLTPMPAFLVVAVLMQSNVRGQDGDTPPEIKALERLVGTWKVEQIVKVPKENGPTKLDVKRELVLGGRFVQEAGGFDDKGKPGFAGMYTYDSNRKTYRYWLFVSGGFYNESTGTWDEQNQTFTFTSKPADGVAGAITIRFLDETTFVHSIISRDSGGKILYHQEGKSVRQE